MKGLAVYSLVLVAIFFLFIFNALAQVPVEPQSAMDVLALMPQLQDAIDAKDWAMSLCIGLMTLTWAVKRFALPKDGSRDGVLPLVSAGFGGLLGMGASILTGSGDVGSATVGGVMLGNAASGAYDMLFKSPKKLRKKKVQVEDEEFTGGD
jgi:hypothetical protein